MPKWAVYLAIGSAFGMFLLFAYVVSEQHRTERKPASEQNPYKVCKDAWEREARHELDFHASLVPYVDVVLRGDDCFGPTLQLPAEWTRWEKQFMTDDPNDHVYLWFEGNNPIGPYYQNGIPRFESAPAHWRLKGRGTLRYFRTAGTGTGYEPRK